LFSIVVSFLKRKLSILFRITSFPVLSAPMRMLVVFALTCWARPDNEPINSTCMCTEQWVRILRLQTQKEKINVTRKRFADFCIVFMRWASISQSNCADRGAMKKKKITGTEIEQRKVGESSLRAETSRTMKAENGRICIIKKFFSQKF